MLGLAFFVFGMGLASFSASSPLVSADALTQGVVVQIDEEKAYHLFAPSDPEVSIATEAFTFDFGDTEDSLFYDEGAGACHLTADYDFANSGTDKTIEMGFPFVNSFSDFPLKEIAISDGLQELPYHTYYGKRYSERQSETTQTFINTQDFDNLTLATALEQSVSEENHLEATRTVIEYRFDLSDVTSELGLVTLQADPAVTSLLLDPNVFFTGNGFSGSGPQTLTLVATPSVDQPYLSFSVLGEDVSNVQAFGSDEGLENRVPFDENSVITRSVINFREKVLSVSEASLNHYATHIRYDSEEGQVETVVPLDLTQATHILEYELVDALTDSSIVQFNYLMQDAWYSDRVITVVFETALVSGSGNTFSVAYPYHYGEDRTYWPNISTLSFVSNLGKQWGEISDLTFKVIPPSDQQIANSSISFEKQNDGTFLAVLEELPDENIHFAVSKAAHPINPGQAIFDFLVLTWKVCVFLALYIIGPSLVLGGIALAIIFGIRGKRKRRAKELQKPAERTLEK